MLLLGEGPTGAVLQVEGDCDVRDRKSVTSLQTALRGARIAIARRVFENAGASLLFADDGQLVLRIPIRAAVSPQRIQPNLEPGSLSQR